VPRFVDLLRRQDVASFVIRSSATINDVNTNNNSRRTSSEIPGHWATSRDRSIANGVHCESSRRRYIVCGSLS